MESSQAVIIGSVTIGEKCYMQSGCVLNGELGRIVIGSHNIFEENVQIVNQTENEIVIGDYNHFKEGCIINAISIGNCCEIGAKAIIGSKVKLGDCVSVCPGIMMLYEDEISSNTRVYSANTQHPPYLQHSVSSINPDHHKRQMDKYFELYTRLDGIKK